MIVLTLLQNLMVFDGFSKEIRMPNKITAWFVEFSTYEQEGTHNFKFVRIN